MLRQAERHFPLRSSRACTPLIGRVEIHASWKRPHLATRALSLPSDNLYDFDSLSLHVLLYLTRPARLCLLTFDEPQCRVMRGITLSHTPKLLHINHIFNFVSSLQCRFRICISSYSTIEFNHPSVATLTVEFFLKLVSRNSLPLWECGESKRQRKNTRRKNQS